MRVCPTCHRLYDDEALSVCPDDGDTLFTPKPGSKFTHLDVKTASPDEATALIDIEQLKKLHQQSQQPAVPATKQVKHTTKSRVKKKKKTAPRQRISKALFQRLAFLLFLIAFVGATIFFTGLYRFRICAIESSPPGAQVAIDGHEHGQTPLKLFLKTGEHRLILSADGYHPVGETIRIDDFYTQLVRPLTAVSNGTIPQPRRQLAKTENLKKASALVEEAEAFMKAGNLKLASDLLIDATKASPTFATPYLLLARLAALQGDRASAIELATRYLRLGGQDADAQVAAWLSTMKKGQ